MQCYNTKCTPPLAATCCSTMQNIAGSQEMPNTTHGRREGWTVHAGGTRLHGLPPKDNPAQIKCDHANHVRHPAWQELIVKSRTLLLLVQGCLQSTACTVSAWAIRPPQASAWHRQGPASQAATDRHQLLRQPAVMHNDRSADAHTPAVHWHMPPPNR